jgi:hypothetical protein
MKERAVAGRAGTAPIRYRIVVRGELRASLAGPLEDMSVRSPVASPFATPESFRAAAAASADPSLLKMAKTTVLFDMNIPSCTGQAG